MLLSFAPVRAMGINEWLSFSLWVSASYPREKYIERASVLCHWKIISSKSCEFSQNMCRKKSQLVDYSFATFKGLGLCTYSRLFALSVLFAIQDYSLFAKKSAFGYLTQFLHKTVPCALIRIHRMSYTSSCSVIFQYSEFHTIKSHR